MSGETSPDNASSAQPSEESSKRRGATKWDLACDLIAFVGTVIAVSVFDWKTKDVIWGLWTCSLVFGYTTIVLSIFAPVFRAKSGEGFSMATGGLFLLAFFTLHFGGFHIGHAMFLNVFFPLIEGGDGFPNPVEIVRVALTLYWPIVAATFVSRFRDLPLSGKPLGGDALIKPYANVIRMHILIFVFAGFQGLNMGDLAIYPVLLFYFFPWSSLLRIKPKSVLAS